MYELIAELPSKVAVQVLDELADLNFVKRTHGTPSCHNAGCRGPLCKKINRDKSRELYRKNNPTVVRPRRATTTDTDKILDTLISELSREKASNAVA